MNLNVTFNHLVMGLIIISPILHQVNTVIEFSALLVFELCLLALHHRC